MLPAVGAAGSKWLLQMLQLLQLLQCSWMMCRCVARAAVVILIGDSCVMCFSIVDVAICSLVVLTS